MEAVELAERYRPARGRCKHPPERLRSGFYDDAEGDIAFWVACGQCGKMLRDGKYFKGARRARRGATLDGGPQGPEER